MEITFHVLITCSIRFTSIFNILDYNEVIWLTEIIKKPITSITAVLYLELHKKEIDIISLKEE